MDKSGSKVPGLKVKQGQVWENGARRVIVTKVDRGWVVVLNSFGTLESYVVSKSGRDQHFYDFRFLKQYERREDFPSVFQSVDKI